MRFKLSARNKETKKDVTLQWFDDENMFDTMLDTVDPEIYQDAMILEMTGTFPVCKKYKEFKDYTPYFETHKKLERKRRNESKRK